MSLSVKTGEPEIYLSLKEYSDSISSKSSILAEIFSRNKDIVFSENFTKASEIRGISLKKSDLVTVESENFDNSNDTYGFLNIYSGKYKFTYPFKKIGISHLNSDFSLAIREKVSNRSKGNIFLNSGGMLSVSAQRSIYIPSEDTLNFSLYYSDIYNFTEEYLFSKDRSYFYSGIDDLGLFTIDLAGKNCRRFASRFRITDYDHHNVNNINADLSALIIKWKGDSTGITGIDRIVSEKVSDFSNKNTPVFPDLEGLISRATVIHEKKVNISSITRKIDVDGIFLFEEFSIEESPLELEFSGNCSIGSVRELNISRNILCPETGSFLNILNFSGKTEDFRIKCTELSANIFSQKTPVFSSPLKLEGNMTNIIFDKNNIMQELNIIPDKRDNRLVTIVTISPIINYFSGDF